MTREDKVVIGSVGGECVTCAAPQVHRSAKRGADKAAPSNIVKYRKVLQKRHPTAKIVMCY